MPRQKNPAPRRKKTTYVEAKWRKPPTSLAEADSREQLEALYAAAGAGKAEIPESLQDDIDASLIELQRVANDSGYWGAVEPVDEWYENEYVIDQIVKHIVDEHGFAGIEFAGIEDVVRSAVGLATSSGPRSRRGGGIFDIEERYSRDTTHVADVPHESELYISFDEDQQKIPSNLVRAALSEKIGDAEDWYDGVSDGGDHWSLVVEDEPSRVVVNDEKLHEFVHDIKSTYYSKLFDKDPEAGKARLIAEIDTLTSTGGYSGIAGRVGDRLRKHAKDIPDAEWGSFASALWGGGSADEDGAAAIELITEYLDFLEAPPIEETDPSRLVGTVDFELPASARGRVDQAREEDRPPWRVVRLSPGELSVEGTRLRHCVGKKEMGYVRALAKGRIEIWSVRTSNNKPIFTMEVDAAGINMTEEDFYRKYATRSRAGTHTLASVHSEAIKQVKGATNRLPGFDGGAGRGGADRLTRPQEVDRLATFFNAIGVDPFQVSDMTRGLDAMDRLLEREARPNPSGARRRTRRSPDRDVADRPSGGPGTGFDRPYHDRPYRAAPSPAGSPYAPALGVPLGQRAFTIDGGPAAFYAELRDLNPDEDGPDGGTDDFVAFLPFLRGLCAGETRVWGLPPGMGAASFRVRRVR